MNTSFWDERYATTRYVYGTEPNEFMAGRAAVVQVCARRAEPVLSSSPVA